MTTAFLIFLLALLVELSYRYLWVIRDKRRGTVVICDRYVFDLMSGEMHGVTKQYRFIRSTICKLFPKPDITFLLWGSAELISSRKADLDIETMKRMLSLYEELQSRWDFVRVSVEPPPAVVAKDILKQQFGRFIELMRT